MILCGLPDAIRHFVYLIKEFKRLKEDENRRLSLAWNLNRTLSKLNYRIHTDAVKAHLIPPEVTPAQAAITYFHGSTPLQPTRSNGLVSRETIR